MNTTMSSFTRPGILLDGDEDMCVKGEEREREREREGQQVGPNTNFVNLSS